MPTLVNRIMRTPWGFGVVIVMAVFGIVANEVSHRHELVRLAESQNADEVIRQVSDAHYNALDRVNALRAYLLEPHERWIARYQEADGRLGASIAVIGSSLAQRPQDSGRAAAQRLSEAFTQRSADLARGWAHAQAGRAGEALATLSESDAAGHGNTLRTALRQAVELAQADRVEADARLLASTRTLRWVVHGLLAAMVLAAYALLRHNGVVIGKMDYMGA